MSEDISIDEALKRGIEAHKVGKFEEADRYYTAILKSQPKHPDANHNMGVLAVGVGRLRKLCNFLKTSLEVNPSIEQFWLSFIDALIKLEKFSDAEKVLGTQELMDLLVRHLKTYKIGLVDQMRYLIKQ